MLTPLVLASCNTAPLWPDRSVAPGGKAPWSGPTDRSCHRVDDPDAFEVDGFLFCEKDNGLAKVPVDDPIYASCDADMGQDATVLSVFDGVRARAYPVALLEGRELVNTEWDGEPVLVDY